MKIYTKKGDQGETTLIGGTRVPKCHVRIACYGTVDELNSYLGLVDHLMPTHSGQKKVIRQVQDRLFVIGSQLAKDQKARQIQLPQLDSDDVLLLERAIDAMTDKLPPLTSFILPGGSQAASYCHVARCVCRRAERKVVALSLKDYVDPLMIIYLNRLSDYLFVLARFLNKQKGIKDIPWRPAKLRRDKGSA